MALTAKQQRFVAEYLVDLNATQAAIRAGYSEKSADKIGSQLLGKTGVAAGISAAKEARSKRTGIDADWVLRRLAQDATADLADLYTESGELKPVKEWPMAWRTGLVAGVETARERDDADDEGNPNWITVRKVKLMDRARLLEMIGKHIEVGAFKDKVEHSGEIKTPELKLVLHGTKPAPAANSRLPH